MECQARKNGWIHDSVFLQILPDVLHKPDVLFAPDIANKAGVQLLPIDQAVDQGWLNCLVDADLSNTRSKHQLRRLEKYELLVPVSIPLDLIVNLPDN